MTGDAVRIAMWSGPRTVSTALMRAWENRPDTVVTDEPLYAFYLARTGLDHPGRDDVLRSQPTDWQVVARSLTSGPLPAGRAISYQKHMTHHLLPEVDRAALAPLRHAFLIRDPAELLASYARVRATPTLDDLGLWQQAEIFDAFGGPVLDSRDLLERPEPMLRALCSALGVPFCLEMLSWPAGRGAAMESGRRTGTSPCGGPLASPGTGRRTPCFPPGWPRWPSNASRSTSGCAPAA